MANEEQHNEQTINNLAPNQGPQGNFYGPVTIIQGQPPTAPDIPTEPLPPERQQEVELFTKPPTGTTAREPRSIDWSGFFAANSRPHRADVWPAVIQPDLNLLRGELGHNRVQRVLLYPRLHNGLGFAIGYTFRRAMRLTVEQPFPNAGVQMWASDAVSGGVEPLEVDDEAVSASADAIVCALSISRNVLPGVNMWLQAPDAPALRRRIHIMPPGGPAQDAVPNEAHAVAYANQIGNLLRRKRDQSPGTVIHLFAALPLGLEILIGLQMNACEPIQVYGYDNVQASYYPFYRLG